MAVNVRECSSIIMEMFYDQVYRAHKVTPNSSLAIISLGIVLAAGGYIIANTKSTSKSKQY